MGTLADHTRLTPTPDIAQHYLTHLLREKLVESKSRVVIVSSGALRRVTDTGTA